MVVRYRFCWQWGPGRLTQRTFLCLGGGGGRGFFPQILSLQLSPTQHKIKGIYPPKNKRWFTGQPTVSFLSLKCSSLEREKRKKTQPNRMRKVYIIFAYVCFDKFYCTARLNIYLKNYIFPFNKETAHWQKRNFPFVKLKNRWSWLIL